MKSKVAESEVIAEWQIRSADMQSRRIMQSGRGAGECRVAEKVVNA